MPNVNLFNLFPNVTLYLKSVVDVITSINVYSLSTTFSISHITTDLISSNLTHFSFFSTKQTSLNESTTLRASLKETTFYNSENITNIDSNSNTTSSLSEVSNSYRFNRFSNPLISYDYKCGHYLGI